MLNIGVILFVTFITFLSPKVYVVVRVSQQKTNFYVPNVMIYHVTYTLGYMRWIVTREREREESLNNSQLFNCNIIFETNVEK
jgi:hypothetical protein